MTHKIGDAVLIEREPPAACELCGETAELRPYGPDGKRICFRCAMKDPKATMRRLAEFMSGRKTQ